MTPLDRLYELCADRALVGLGPAEEAELAALARQHPGLDIEAFERAAAAVALAAAKDDLAPMPAHLAARIEAAAPGALPSAFDARPKHLARTHVMPHAAPVQPARMQNAPASNVVPLRPSRVWLVAGWVAAAACLVLAIGAIVVARRTTVALKAPVTRPSATPSSARAELIAKAGSKVTPFTATTDPTAHGASGDVVWNAAEQRGYMRFAGLAKNDPKAFQYQLWIFDKDRDDKYPVDGGVFDVDATTGDVIVPIKAALPVQEVALFAVTVERPGGVVVSKRERIVVTAKPAG